MSESRNIAEFRRPGPPGPPGPGPGPSFYWPPPSAGTWPRPPDWYSGLYWLDKAWDDVRATKAFLRRVITEMFEDDPSFLGGGMPQVGVTDGSDAQPGMVGEYISICGATTNHPAFGVWGTPFQFLTLSAGDWDISGSVEAPWVAGTNIEGWISRVPGWPDVTDQATVAPGVGVPYLTSYAQRNDATQGDTLVLGTERIRLAQVQPVWLCLALQGTALTPGADFYYSMWARRRR